MAVDVPIVGGSAPLEHAIRAALDRFPLWYQRAARVSRIVISTREDVRAQIAMYEHGSREMLVSPGASSVLVKAIGHELAHGCDDIFDQHHYFTGSDVWRKIHANQSYFDIDKYRDEPLEYFADMVVKLFMLGPQKLATTNPDEVTFISTWVFPVLQHEFG